MSHPSSQSPTPTVHLVGAGPGDPSLITVRGAKLLEQADIVVYDYLAAPRLLSCYCPHAQQIYVGKKAAAHSMTQEQINQLLIDHARAGKRVVRLKGGDPFVFGRGGEEALALVAANIPFEVVPGITAAIAAAAYAGIPITHRDLNSSFTLLTGHEREEQYQDPTARDRATATSSDLDYAALAKLPCLAFYMGVKSLPRISAKLIENGMPPATPAAAIQWGTTPRQRTIVGTLATLPTLVADANLAPPALTIIGQVVSLRATLNWFESRPLFGQTIVVTRTRHHASELSDKLESLGANVLEAPTIELAPGDPVAIDSALADAVNFDWIVFTSVNGVSAVKRELFARNLDARVFGNAQIATIGSATATALYDQLALRVDLCPKEFIAEALADEFAARNEIANKKFLLLRADIARPLLRDRLIAAHAAEVRDVPIYHTLPAPALTEELLAALDARQIHWITFTSSSTARNFLDLLGPTAPTRLQNVRLASIGPITSATLRDAGHPPHVEAQQHDIPGLIASLLSSPPR